MKKSKNEEKSNKLLINWQNGLWIAEENPIIGNVLSECRVFFQEDTPYPSGGLARVSKEARIYCNPKRYEEPRKWAWAIAHCAMHVAMGHFIEKENPDFWNTACDYIIERFLLDIEFMDSDWEVPKSLGKNEEIVYGRFLENGLPKDNKYFGTAAYQQQDMIFKDNIRSRWDKWNKEPDWSSLLAQGFNEAVRTAVNKAAGVTEEEGREKTQSYLAKEWFISSYPLLGSIVSNFKIIEDEEVCMRMDISIAAVSCSLKEIYINPRANLNNSEIRFVMAHEILHAALRHDARHQWRDPYLWNVACDFVINGWLKDMQIGDAPQGLLFDEKFKGLSAESIYDRIVNDIRIYKKLATLRGIGLGDILSKADDTSVSTDLDNFYRRALSQGLEYHQSQGRGYLPSDLIEEIRALMSPPIPWDVELARWFNETFQPLEKQRTYARVSRRQSSTPDIPRPSWIVNQEMLNKRTFGVVLDTSGSMDRSLLALCLGAIASYSNARDVPATRVVFCDAAAYDQGYMKPEDIAGVVKVKGRGGTILQPGIDLLINAEDFPKGAPILIITDGECESRLIFYGREHAYLIPEKSTLPFTPKGKVFRIRK